MHQYFIISHRQSPGDIYTAHLWLQSPLTCVKPLIISAASCTVSELRLIQGPLSPVYRWYLSGLIQLPMNIGMCLQPIDPAIRGGDHRVSQTQFEHDISLASDTHAHACVHTLTFLFTLIRLEKCKIQTLRNMQTSI